MNFIKQKSDSVGAIASSLCLVHCLATPLIFITQTCNLTCCSSAPTWWQWIDYLFLIISFFAVYRSTQNSSKKWVKVALWISWLLLCTTIINDKLNLITLDSYLNYLPALCLIVLHLYNKKFCQCTNNECCIE